MSTIRESISRLRNELKVVREDAFVTDRFLYSMILKYSKSFIRRDKVSMSLFNNSSLFQEITCLELIDVSKIPDNCIGVSINTTIKRSKNKLPTISYIDNGPVVAYVSSLDYSEQAVRTEPAIYNSISKSSSFKYNRQVYYWITDGYLYIPNCEWEAVRVKAMYEEVVEDDDNIDCTYEQDRALSIPEYLYTEVEAGILKELATYNNHVLVSPISDTKNDVIS